MGKTSTLIYLYSNFDEHNEIIINDKLLVEFQNDSILRFIDKHTKKVPDEIVNNIMEFAKKYS